MSFQPITVGPKVFNLAGDGRYMLSTVGFGSPLDYFKISGGTRNAKTGVTSASVSRILQKDVTSGSLVTRTQCSIQLVIQVPQGFTSAELDSLTGDISEFLSTGTLDRVLNGES